MLSLFFVMMMGPLRSDDQVGGPGQQGQVHAPERLEGDQDHPTYTDDDGVTWCSSHHDDWEGIEWRGLDGVDRGRSSIYRDDVRAVPDHPWLLMEPASHEIRRRTRRTGRCWGSPYSVATEWAAAPVQVRELLLATPFGLFLGALPMRSPRSSIFLTVLGERWWDTTHTFHWSWGEMTLTPLDLFVLTGIPFGGTPIEIEVPLRFTSAGIIAALGWRPPRRTAGDAIPRGILLARLAEERERVATLDGYMSQQEVRQYARCLLLLMFQECFESRGGDSAHLWWLPHLRFFNMLSTLDWGSFVLAVLYESMDLISRHMALNHRGLSLVWEAWFVAYTIRDLGRVILQVDQPDQFPLLRRYNGENFVGPYAYRQLDFCVKDVVQLEVIHVAWGPWSGFEGRRGYIKALEVSRTRRLVWDEYGRHFYLGERVVRQHTPSEWPRIPHFPPHMMRRTYNLPQCDLDDLADGIHFLLLTEEGDYAAFAERYLMREARGTRGRVFYERYRALGGDDRFIRGQTYLARAVPGQLPPQPSKRDRGLEDSDDNDPDGEREEAQAGDGGGNDSGGGGQVPVDDEVHVEDAQVEEGRVEPDTGDGKDSVVRAIFQVSSETLLDVQEEPQRHVTSCKEPQESMAKATVASAGTTTPVGMRTTATLVDIPTSTYHPPAPQGDIGQSSSSSSPILALPLLPREIPYVGIGVRSYTVPKVPIPEGALRFLDGRRNDEVVSVRVSDLQAVYSTAWHNWNLLLYLGRDPLSFAKDYRSRVERALLQDDPSASVRTRSESCTRQSESYHSRRSHSSSIQPIDPVRLVGTSRTGPEAVPPQMAQARDTSEGSGDSASVTKRARVD